MIGSELAAADVPALVLSEPAGLPYAELLLARGRAEAGERALDRLPWRWRMGGDGAWRLAGMRRYSFDGGAVLTVHRRLPAAPLPSAALRPLEQALWAGAALGADGLLRPSAGPLLVYLAVEHARGALAGSARLAEVRARADETRDWDEVWRLADRIGVAGVLAEALGDPKRGPEGGASSEPGRRVRAAGWSAARALRGRGRLGAVADAVLREPWRRGITRCRFSGLELLSGPGTFLPRGVSERLVTAATEAPLPAAPPVIVDVGTGCGAAALALALRLGARVVGIDVDDGALRWARRNARRLHVPEVEFVAGSLLDPLPSSLRGRVSAVVANVPCVPPGAFEGAADASREAYVGADADGLGLQRRLAEQARDVLRPGGSLLVQLVPSQWPAYRASLAQLGYEPEDAQGDELAVVGVARWPGAA